MEIKAELLKPYGEKERLNFLVENNHKHGYLIEKTENGLIAKGKTDEEENTEKINELKKEFFQSSLGYIRRKVTMADGSIKDFLTDIVPLLQVGINIITYSFTDGEITQNTNIQVTEDFISECKQQLFYDFYGVFPDGRSPESE